MNNNEWILITDKQPYSFQDMKIINKTKEYTVEQFSNTSIKTLQNDILQLSNEISKKYNDNITVRLTERKRRRDTLIPDNLNAKHTVSLYFDQSKPSYIICVTAGVKE